MTRLTEEIMKYRMIVFLVLSLSLGAQTTLSTIESPVETDFGTYTPLPVTIGPNAMQVQLKDDLSNVVNLSDFELTEAQLELLRTNHFVVTPALKQDGKTAYNELFDIYVEARDNHIPQFITTDAMLHSFHLCFDNILKTCEEDRFFAQLDELINGLSAKTWDQYGAATDTTVRVALFRNLDFLQVASELLVEKWYIKDPLPGGKYFEEMSLVKDAAGFHSSPIFSQPEFDYQEDYSQYKPRGHYTKSDSLKDYFRAMMWLGRMTFGCEDGASYSQTMTLSAILMTQAISTLTLSGVPATEIWDDIYQPTVFFVGKSDDINFYQYLEIAEAVYGPDFLSIEPDAFADQNKLVQFLTAAADLEGGAINYPGQPSKGFRFMGQRFIPDSWILDELVALKTSGRFMPTGLDVMTVLGPKTQAETEWAFQYVTEADKLNTDYLTNLNRLKQTFRNYPPETWAQNAYWNWLYCLMPFLDEFGEGYPYFMQTDAWRDRNLFSALASWAELRHDTILYAKQSGTETSMPPGIPLDQGFVEPNPEAFARLASLADFMIEGLKSRDLLFEHFQAALESYFQMALVLKTIAEKELTRTPLTTEEYRTLFDFGKTLFTIVTFDSYGNGPNPWNDEDLDPMPVIADVHTDANTMTVLEEGVGHPYAIFVICSIEGEVVLTKGGGFSYYEFTRPLSEGRLTDEEWRDMLIQSPPDLPAWSGHFISGIEDASASDFYMWDRNWLELLKVTLDNVVLEPDEQLKIRVDAHTWAGEIPVLLIEKPDGTEQTFNLNKESETVWTCIQDLSGWQEGAYYVQVSLQTSEALSRYRTHFTISSGSSVPRIPRPRQCLLFPPSPNPFNPDTKIRFELPTKSLIQLSIFNTRGQQIRFLLREVKPAGRHQVIWDGSNDRGQPMASGVYLVRLITKDRAFSKKIVLVR
jgi:hypothetical protein